MRYSFNLYSLGYSVSIDSDVNVEFFLNSSLKPYAFIPNFNIRCGREKNVAKIKHFQSDKKTISYNKKNNTYLIKDDWLVGIPIYIIYLIFKIFSDGYISGINPYIVFHASAVSKNQKNVSIISYTGGGKTSIMLELIKSYGFKMLSNNKTVFKYDKDGYKIIGGTKAISIRNTLMSKFVLKYQKKEQFIQRQIVLLDDTLLAEFERSKKNNVIVLPQLNEYYKKATKINQKEALFYLFPMALELINREVIFFNGEKVCPNNTIITKKKQQILDILKELISDSIIFQISGPLEFICRKIDEC